MDRQPRLGVVRTILGTKRGLRAFAALTAARRYDAAGTIFDLCAIQQSYV